MARGSIPNSQPDPWEAVTVTMRHGNRYACRPEWFIPATRVGYSTLFYVERGHGWMQRGEERREARPFDLFFNLSGHIYSAGHDPADPVTVLSVGLELRGLGGLDPLHRLALPDRLAVPASHRGRLTRAYERAIAAFADSSPLGGLAQRAAAFELLHGVMEIVTRAPAEACTGRVPPAMPEPRIARVLGYIEEQLASEVDLPALAKLAGLSPAHFATIFRQATGQAPMRYLRLRRISTARQHLAAGHDSVEEVARQVGFADPFHFSRVFRKATGMSPTQYARSVRNPFAASH